MSFLTKFFRFYIRDLDLRPFWISLIGGFLLALFQRFSTQLPAFTNPFPRQIIQPRPDFYKAVMGKIGLNVPHDYKIKKGLSFFDALAAAPYNQARSYLAVDFDSGEVLAEKFSSQKFPIASLTKIMTAVIALDLADRQEKFIISSGAAKVPPTRIGVIAGQKMTLGELLNALLLTSANDAAEVIREGIDEKYKAPVFIRTMNEKARLLGLSQTHFANPQGFDDPQNYSSASDLATLTHYALTNYPLLSEIVAKDYLFFPANPRHKQFDLYNWNGLLGVYQGIKGVKIGNTGQAGYTTVVLSEREGKKVLVVVLGAPDALRRDLWAASLLDSAFSSEWNLKPVGVTEWQLESKYGTWKYWN